ncbi:UDP-N-acetylmuramate--L-alanine ligase [Clostridium sp. CM028]|uniref:UDP-N-acetylmuramate--L-alanine ligase n=1 Tax=unclassified Clostridium TaxID=2614128 RepID=UPI001C0E52B1|nr:MULTISPECIES: UDP-N-acetylmuramate--L-alanine ligase [unclassified Clostridium]MBU3093058.1 UDP-N-acetylmuramate--L-alanine ligase [Clostridium sp. CF011]MBW9148552.1 UDP-N-acetylmuramate--L-alanine ligase [Clostridium sp. CM028]WAG69113.1 UDP-N-acetylmuramate--L-alanine ligase [Clostridium sp. CF011]WLC60849.1 UDP-N-acetylmuramate--L-alanine ligase [Clostridium sp. CM028]
MSFDFIRDKNKKVHFIGIGGISMSGLAEILIKNNYTVSGSDMNSSHITSKLKEKGVQIYIGHNGDNINTADLVVYTAAISPENPEYIKAKELNIPLIDRAEFLGQIMKGHKYNVAVAGTHGKTTTTSMLAHIILKEDVDPTILVGGELDAIGGNVLAGNSDYFITEACEYKASFLKFFPYIGTILNIDADHLDYYKDINHIKDTFIKFINIIPKEGYLVANVEDENVKTILHNHNYNCSILTYGINNGMLKAKDISYNELGCATFDVYKEGHRLFQINLNVPGQHNVLNALASIGTALILNFSENSITRGLSSFKGTHRRFELKGIKNGVTVIDDYAHHPTEIKATLSATKNYPHNKIYCVFQPHTYSRTLSLFEDFSDSFYDMDNLILADIYAAREKDTGVISSNMLGDRIREKSVNCINLHSFDEIVDHLNNNLKEGDILLTMGAGDIVKIGEMYLK